MNLGHIVITVLYRQNTFITTHDYLQLNAEIQIQRLNTKKMTLHKIKKHKSEVYVHDFKV